METQFNRILCTNLIRLRTINRYSQQEISEVIDVTQTSYNRMESGKIRISTFKLFQLAVFYGVQMDELVPAYASERHNEQSLRNDFMQLQERFDSFLERKRA